MFGLTIAFDRPGYLWLLFLLPVVWWMSRRSLAGMGRVRRITAIALRSAVVVLIVLALAEVQAVRIIDRIATYFLLDQSLSVDSQQRQASLAYAQAAIRAHRNVAKEDLAGIVVFGSKAQIESPLYPGDVRQARVESNIPGERTNLAGALRLANAAFPDGSGKRVVIVSDGNQNLGDAAHEAQA